MDEEWTKNGRRMDEDKVEIRRRQDKDKTKTRMFEKRGLLNERWGF